MPYMTYIVHVVTDVLNSGDGHMHYAMPVYVLFVSGTLGIIFNLSDDAITDHNQSAKDIDLF